MSSRLCWINESSGVSVSSILIYLPSEVFMTLESNRSGKFFLHPCKVCFGKVCFAVLLISVVALGQGTSGGGSGAVSPSGGRGAGVSHTIRGKIFLPSGTPPE